jgi:hypothetical protein
MKPIKALRNTLVSLRDFADLRGADPAAGRRTAGAGVLVAGPQSAQEGDAGHGPAKRLRRPASATSRPWRYGIEAPLLPSEGSRKPAPAEGGKTDLASCRAAAATPPPTRQRHHFPGQLFVEPLWLFYREERRRTPGGNPPADADEGPADERRRAGQRLPGIMRRPLEANNPTRHS